LEINNEVLVVMGNYPPLDDENDWGILNIYLEI